MDSGTFSGFIAIVLWSATALVFAMAEGVPAYLIMALSNYVSFLIFFMWDYAKNRDPLNFFKISLIGIVFTTIGIGLYRAVYFYSLKLIPVVEASLINYLWPIFIVFFSCFLPGNQIKIQHFIGLISGFVGLYVLLGDQTNIEITWQFGHLLAFIGAIIWGLYSVFTKIVNKDQKNAVPLALPISGVVFHILHFQIEPNWNFELTPFLFVVLLGFVSGGGYYMWDIGMKRGNVKILSVSAYFIPLLSTALLIVFDKAPNNPNIWLAAILIFAGPIIASKDKVIGLFQKK